MRADDVHDRRHDPRTPRRGAQRRLLAPEAGSALIWVFLAPTLIGLGIFSFIPIIGSVVLAFFRWDIITPPQFVGVDNFVELAANPTVRVSFFNTITFVIAAVIIQLAVALGLAILVQSRCRTGCALSSAPRCSSRSSCPRRRCR